jgi:hypothetical protein
VPLALLILNDHGLLPEVRWPGLNGLLVIPALFVSILIHEFGHLIVGLRAGLGVDRLSVGPFVIFRSADRWAFSCKPMTWYLGSYKPRIQLTCENLSKYAWMIAGGPVGSLLLAAVCGFVAIRFGSGPWAWIGTLFWVTLCLLIFGLVPYSDGVSRSDGARLWQLIRHPDQAKSWVGLAEVLSQETHGMLPREWDSDHFQAMLLVTNSAPEYSFLQMLAHYRRLDEDRNDEALEHLENALSKSGRISKRLRQGIFMEAASASAMMRRRPEQARTWRDRACAIRTPESHEATDAAIAMSEGRYEDALKHWEAARAYFDHLGSNSGLVRFAKMQWAVKEAICKAAMSGATS